MNVIPKRILDEAPEGVFIEFESEFGIGRGIWRSWNPTLDIGTEYSVELDILDDLELGENIELVDNITGDLSDYRLEWLNDRMVIQGKIYVAFDDGSGVAVDIKTRQSNAACRLMMPALIPHLSTYVRISARRIALSDNQT